MFRPSRGYTSLKILLQLKKYQIDIKKKKQMESYKAIHGGFNIRWLENLKI
jgi:hypothetical protein